MNREPKVSVRKSPFWKLWKFIFPEADMATVYIAFGRSIFTPRDDITDDLYVHECVHLRQQRMSYLFGILWWVRYILNKDFRYSQELPAYVEQLRYLINTIEIKDRNQRNLMHREWIDKASKIMSSDMYNRMVDYSQALSDVRTLLYGFQQNQS